MSFLRMSILIGMLVHMTSAQHIIIRLLRDIRPLETTRADVEKRLRQAPLEMSGLHHYDSKDLKVAVSYTTDECILVETGEKLLPGLVRYVTMSSAKALDKKDLPYDLSSFSRREIDRKELPGLWTYGNVEKGVAFDVDTKTRSGRDVVGRVSIYPPGGKQVRCGDSENQYCAHR